MKILPLFAIISLCISCSSCDKNDDSQNNTGTIVPPEEPPVVVVPPMEEGLLLDKVQKDAFKYFWDYAEPNSKLARERYHIEDPGNDAQIVTTGGSGFGLMTLLVGIERNFVTREAAVARLQTALTFLENADRFHGAWPHWMNGNTGNVIPFGAPDDGGDLVETSFLCQALICVREYFKNGTAEEQALAAKADQLWKGVEWSWYTKGGENALYWHWSPNNGWQINFKLEGYNECLITYIMAASSPTHPVGAAAYHQAWARNGAIESNNTSWGLPVILKYNGTSGVGPMFWSHYSYMGLDPEGLSDQYADSYWDLVVNHAKIQYAFCVANPNGYTGYSDKVWGLTASYTRNGDGTVGYSAHAPNNDRGVISPTAALSSYPYTPAESLKHLRFLYEDASWKDRVIGPAGPYDAFSTHYNWVTRRYLAIDQGTIAPMIENHRTGLLWELFMNAPEVKQGLLNLGFHSSKHGI